jgi:predicted amidohydrolase
MISRHDSGGLILSISSPLTPQLTSYSRYWKGKHLKVCIAQVESIVGQLDLNTTRMEKVLTDSKGKCDLVVFPECMSCGYGSITNDRDQSELVNLSSEDSVLGPTFRRMQVAARTNNVAVIYGFAEKGKGVDDNNYIALNFISKEGVLLYTYRKTHRWTPSAYERLHFVNGDKLAPVVEINGVMVSTAICFDLEVVETCRSLALSGAELIVTMGANGDSFVMDTVVRVRAYENLCHIIYCNQMMAPSVGMSCCAGPDGKFLTPPMAYQAEDLQFVDIKPHDETFAKFRERNPLLRVRTPSLYSPVVAASVLR